MLHTKLFLHPLKPSSTMKSIQSPLPLIYYFPQCFTLFISIILFSRLWVHHWLNVLSFFLQASLSSSVIFTDELTWISLAYKSFFFSWNLVNVILLSSGKGMFFFVVWFRIYLSLNVTSKVTTVADLQYTRCHITYWRHKNSIHICFIVNECQWFSDHFVLKTLVNKIQ